MSHDKVLTLERALKHFTGAPYVVLTDCCTHAIEVCLRLVKPKKVQSSCWTYLSVPMVYRKLGIEFELIDEKWQGEYRIHGTKIWDSARWLGEDMYRPGHLQCLSFGNGKPLDNKRGGAILCDNEQFYHTAKQMCWDGRDMSIQPWNAQTFFRTGYHYNMPVEHAVNILGLLDKYIAQNKSNYKPQQAEYPDCRQIRFLD